MPTAALHDPRGGVAVIEAAVRSRDWNRFRQIRIRRKTGTRPTLAAGRKRTSPRQLTVPMTGSLSSSIRLQGNPGDSGANRFRPANWRDPGLDEGPFAIKQAQADEVQAQIAGRLAWSADRMPARGGDGQRFVKPIPR